MRIRRLAHIHKNKWMRKVDEMRIRLAHIHKNKWMRGG